MDKLDSMFTMQKAMQEKLGYYLEDMSTEELVDYIKEYTLHMEHEMHEMLQELPYFKKWKTYSSDANVHDLMLEKAMHEWADVTHFFLNISLALGFDADALLRMYTYKNQKNHERQEDTVNYKPCIGG